MIPAAKSEPWENRKTLDIQKAVDYMAIIQINHLEPMQKSIQGNNIPSNRSLSNQTSIDAEHDFYIGWGTTERSELT